MTQFVCRSGRSVASRSRFIDYRRVTLGGPGVVGGEAKCTSTVYILRSVLSCPPPKNTRILFRDTTLAEFLRHKHRYPSSKLEASYRPMGCCSSTATIPSEPASAPASLVTEKTTPVLSQSIAENSSVPSSHPPFRSRAAFRPKSARPTINFSQAAPQPRQSLKSTLPQDPTTRAESPSAPNPSSRPDVIFSMPGESDA